MWAIILKLRIFSIVMLTFLASVIKKPSDFSGRLS
jgi:hypothetical protein